METGQNTNQQNSEWVHKGPRLSVDTIIDMGAGLIVLVKRKNEPFGWALPGGFVEYGESTEEAALRETLEETSLRVEIVKQFHTYSSPKRDPRFHTVSVVFVARGWGEPKAADDAAEVGLFHEMNLPEDICFDHKDIIRDYFHQRY